ncbi:hypothetical protein [Hymenobacter sp. B81]|uniref:hypothetical protein n=1 Tax=Hymenobacter sp. B81 TaxID=3344878 RepID=UPI0037DC8ABB
MTNKEKRELALSYFLNSTKSQQEIAARVGVSENTLSTWKKEGGWDTIKGAKTATRQEIITELYQQISLIKDQAVDADGKRRVMTTAETQAIRMISKSIAELDKKLSIDTYIQVIEEYTTTLFAGDATEAKRQMPHLDRFIERKFTELG